MTFFYLDFSKAFDKISHLKLLQKLNNLNINNKLVLWVKNWLLNRKQRVVLNGEYSGWITVTSGVPQGSILGPLMFLVFINDLNTGLNSDASIFADDTKIGRCIENEKDCGQLQIDINRIVDWCSEWKMELNAEKCHIMHFGKTNKRYTYEMNGCKVSVVKEQEDLGVIVDENLNFSSHHIKARNKANKIVGFIKLNR